MGTNTKGWMLEERPEAMAKRLEGLTSYILLTAVMPTVRSWIRGCPQLSCLLAQGLRAVGAARLLLILSGLLQHF